MRILFTLICALTLSAPHLALAGGGHDHGHGEHEEVVIKKGPHNGRLLADHDFALEVTIFEDGVPPQYRIYPFYDGEAVSPEEVQLKIELSRFGGQTDDFDFLPENGYLTSKKIVEEPHSFDVKVTAAYQEKNYTWDFESHEGRTELSHAAIKDSGVGIEVAGPEQLSNSVKAYGRILVNENRIAHIVPRFSGVIREMKVALGDSVEKGSLLATIESNQSLTVYEVRAPLSGVVLKRHGTLGEFVSDAEEILVVADLSEVWADFQIYRDELASIVPGQNVEIDLGDGAETLKATVSYVSPITDLATQSNLIRVVLPNPEGKLRPGLFVSCYLTSSSRAVPLAVRKDALQTFRDWKVVYLTDGHTFQAMPVEIGASDREFVEIISGIKPGDKYVSKNSFLIKADIEKSGASHDH